MARLSTHVLDASRGVPAQGVVIDLHAIRQGERVSLKTAVTNQQGRTEQPLLSGVDLTTGIYELTFHAGDYFRGIGMKLSDPPFLDEIVIRFGIADPAADYHVPLLMGPFSYSTYRGILMDYLRSALQGIDRCRLLATFSEEPGWITRTFLSEPMHAVHTQITTWMEDAGMNVHVDAAGNLRGLCPASRSNAPRFIIGSHLDTVPHAGAFDGILGVMLGIALIEQRNKRGLNFDVEIVGFSEEEGVRFGVPFIGSRALIEDLPEELLTRPDKDGITVRDAIRGFGLDPSQIRNARLEPGVVGYLEFHIEQGPVLESLDRPLGVVETIVGQSRLDVVFEGQANHAGTTPMHLRKDALAGASEWTVAVEREARSVQNLVATVGQVTARPGATNVIAGSAQLSLDVRHADDAVRRGAVDRLLRCTDQIASRRGLTVLSQRRLDQSAVRMDDSLRHDLQSAVERAGFPVHVMNSGAGHDAMILAPRIPAAMLFVRSPGGISHHPDEAVVPEDVAAALKTGVFFLEQLEARLA